MKFEKPVYIALLSSLIAGVFFLFFFLILDEFVFETELLSLFATFIVAGLSSFFLFKYLAEVYITNKIQLIQKSIHDTKLNPQQEYDRAKSSDLDKIGKEVSAWKNEYKSEIDSLKSREKFRREFIGNVSHELKTPIFNIQGYILTLLDGGLQDEEINYKYLKRASKSVDRMIDLIHDMDTLNKLESGVMDFKLKKFNIFELVQDVVDMLVDKAKESNVKLRIVPPKDKVLKVNADPNRIEQVLFNLIINAIKYNKTVNGKVEISFYDLEDKYLIEVADNGLGIPEADLPRVFERFYRVDKSRVRYTGGSGLGLSIVKHIIDLHRQTINIRSSEDVGTTITFTLDKA